MMHENAHSQSYELQLRILWEGLLPRFNAIEVVGEPVRAVSNFLRGYTSMPENTKNLEVG
jgi:hypothetical protein